MLDTFENDMILSAVQQLTTEVQRVEGKVQKVTNDVAAIPEIPTPAAADAGKVIKVGETGSYELGEGGGGGTPVMHTIKIGQDTFGTYIENVNEFITSIDVLLSIPDYDVHLTTFVDSKTMYKNYDVADLGVPLITYDENGTIHDYTGVHNFSTSEAWIKFEMGSTNPDLRYVDLVQKSSESLEYALMIDLDTGAIIYETSGN